MYKNNTEPHNSSSDLSILLSTIFHIASIACVPFLANGTVNGNIYACGLLMVWTIYYSIRLFKSGKMLGLAFFLITLSAVVFGIYKFGLMSQYKNAKIYLEEEKTFCRETTYETLLLKYEAQKSMISAAFRACLDKQHIPPESCIKEVNHGTSLNEVMLGNRLLRLTNCANSLSTKEKSVDRLKNRPWVKFWMGLL
ncbi:MAG: hypothetical protein HY895_19000 [Deltaproteobacteria bacterium]|nr:hypothetical protein [Deltaproteobacteria bacterium]